MCGAGNIGGACRWLLRIEVNTAAAIDAGGKVEVEHLVRFSLGGVGIGAAGHRAPSREHARVAGLLPAKLGHIGAADLDRRSDAPRSEDRRVGKRWCSTGRYRR